MSACMCCHAAPCGASCWPHDIYPDTGGVRGYVATGRHLHGEASATGARKTVSRTRGHAMTIRLKRAGHRSRYRLRKQVVEPVFGQIKQARGFRQFWLRGLSQVAGEWSLVCSAHNVLKLAGARGCIPHNRTASHPSSLRPRATKAARCRAQPNKHVSSLIACRYSDGLLGVATT